MPGLPRIRRGGEHVSANAAVPAETRRARTSSVLMRGYLRWCRFAAWVDDYLNSVREQNEVVAIEDTKAYLRAKRRSLALMQSLLSPEQREEFNRYHYFHVTGGKTGMRYRIRIASFANIDVIGSAGSVLYRLCAHPAGDVPVYDMMAAQMLHLQDAATEHAFLKNTNVHPALQQRMRAEWMFWT
ncbi:MAG TPA: hypothetical protein VHK70_03010 [Burkholderiaceae bacterium]|nr:hypothetical protein [Burkholderiaceae bacterium]